MAEPSAIGQLSDHASLGSSPQPCPGKRIESSIQHLAPNVGKAVRCWMREMNTPPVVRHEAKPSLRSFARALWSSGRGWAAWPVRAAWVAVYLGGGLALLLAPTSRWPLAAGVAVVLLVMVAVASFLAWRTELLNANAAFEMLEPRFRIVPVVAESRDRVRAVVEVVNDSQVRVHNLRVAVVDASRKPGEATDEEAIGLAGLLPLEGSWHPGEGTSERYSVTLDGSGRFDLAMGTASYEGVFQCARNRSGEGPPLLREGETYVFRVEAAADGVPRVQEVLELRTTAGGPIGTDPEYGHAVRRRLPEFAFDISSEASPATESDREDTPPSP